MFPNRNENTGRHEPTVSHFAWFFLARRYFQSESARPSREDKDEPCDADIISVSVQSRIRVCRNCTIFNLT